VLYSLKIQNFKSILDETIYLNYGEGKAPNGYKTAAILPFLEINQKKQTIQTRLVPCLMFLGANASGKSNLIEAFFRLKKAVLEGIDKNFIPNKLNYKFNTTTFELVFFIAKNRYKYFLEYNKNQIIKESLNKDDSLVYEIIEGKSDFQKIEAKGYSSTDFQHLLEVECSTIKDDGKFLQQYTFLSKVCAKYPGLDKSLAEVFDYFKSKMQPWVNNDIHHSLVINKLATDETQGAIQNSFQRIATLVKKLDIDIEEFVLDREIKEYDKIENLKLNQTGFIKIDKDKVTVGNDDIIVKHKDINNNIVDFKLSEESLGTRILFGLIGICLSALDNGGILIIDEFDRSLHPILFKQLIKLFKDTRYNKNNAQLIFTTHTTDILDDDIIRVSEIGIVTKTLKSGTTLKRLCDFENIRNVNNFRKQYLEGKFSGIPFSYI
jgi:uncharacterized protein